MVYYGLIWVDVVIKSEFGVMLGSLLSPCDSMMKSFILVVTGTIFYRALFEELVYYDFSDFID